MCNQAPETIEHLLMHCPIAREVWWQALSHIQMQTRFNMSEATIINARNNLRAALRKSQRKGIDTLFMLISWQLWNERNGRVFRNEASTMQALLQKIKDEACRWIAAGAKDLGRLMS